MALLQHFQEPDSHVGVWWVYSSVEVNINWLDLVWGEREQGRYGGDTQISSPNPIVCQAWFVVGCRLELERQQLFRLPRVQFGTPRSFHQAEFTSKTGRRPPELVRDVCGVGVQVLADMSMASSRLHRYQESSWHGFWQKQCGSKASGCGSSFLLPQISGRGTNFLDRPSLLVCLKSSPENLA